MRRISWTLVLVACVLALYLPTLGFEFVYDDEIQIRQLPALAGGDGSPLRMAGGPEGRYWRPVFQLFQLGLYRLAGASPRAFHAASVAVYALLCLIVLHLYRRLVKDQGTVPSDPPGGTREGWLVAGAAALLFAVHPLHAEAVAFVASMTELTVTLFVVGAFACWLAASGSEGLRACAWFAATGVLFFAALLSKEMALGFPAIVLLAMALRIPAAGSGTEKSGSDPNFARVIAGSAMACLVPLALWAGLRWRAVGGLAPTSGHAEVPPAGLPLNALWIVAQDLWLLAAPVRLNAARVFRPIVEVSDVRVWIGAATLATGAAAVVLLRRHRTVAFGTGWTIVTLAPLLSIRSFGEFVVCDRYLLLPSAGFCLAVAAAAFRWLPRRTAVACLALLGALYATRSAVRLPDWKDSLTLYRRTLEASPDAASLHNNLGVVLLERGDAAAAADAFERAVALQRGFADAWGGLATARERQGRLEDAERALLRRTALPPDDAHSYANLGTVQSRLGRRDAAIEAFRRASALDPGSAAAQLNLGVALAGAGRAEEALPHLRACLERDPSQQKARVALAVCLAGLGRLDEAREEARRVSGPLAAEPVIRAILAAEGTTALH